MFNIASLFWGKKQVKHHKRKKRRRHRRPVSPNASIEQFVVEEIVLGDVSTPSAPTIVKKKHKSSANVSLRLTLSWCGLWLILFAAGFLARPLWPSDETRLLAIAWEMWQHGGFFVPKLNGEVFFQQPPLALWLIHAGWAFFGVNDWWPRLMPSLFALGSLYLTGRLAGSLWHESKDIARYAPLILLGCLFWGFSSTLALADMLRVFFVLLSLWAVLRMWRARTRQTWILLGTALGLGILAGGLLTTVYVLPVALLAPLWMNESPMRKGWYADIFAALTLAALIMLIWATPMILHAGPALMPKVLAGLFFDYGLAFFPMQQPWWWYLALVPVLFLPWTLLPLLWLRLWAIRSDQMNAGMLFCLNWAVPAVIILSVIAMKQPQLVLPILPALSLVAAYLMFDDDLSAQGQDGIGASMILPLILLGAVLAVVPGLPRNEYLPSLLWELSPFVGITISLVGVALAWLPSKKFKQRIVDTSITCVFLLVIINFGFGLQFGKFNQIEAVSQMLADAQNQGRPIAHVGDYAGEFQFAGRLSQPLDVIAPEDVATWSSTHTDGLIVSYSDRWQPDANISAPIFESTHLDRILHIWDAGTVVRGKS